MDLKNIITKPAREFTCDWLSSDDDIYSIYLKKGKDRRITYTYSYDTTNRVLYNLYNSIINEINSQIKLDKDKLKIEDYSIKNDYHSCLLSLPEKYYSILPENLGDNMIQYISDHICNFVHNNITIEPNNPVSIKFENNGETVCTELFNQSSSDPNCISQFKKGEEIIGYRYYYYKDTSSKDCTFFFLHKKWSSI